MLCTIFLKMQKRYTFAGFVFDLFLYSSDVPDFTGLPRPRKSSTQGQSTSVPRYASSIANHNACIITHRILNIAKRGTKRCITGLDSVLQIVHFKWVSTSKACAFVYLRRVYFWPQPLNVFVNFQSVGQPMYFFYQACCNRAEWTTEALEELMFFVDA